MEKRYQGRVLVEQGKQREQADATIAVEPEGSGGGWEIAVRADPSSGLQLDPSRLAQVRVPSGGSGWFVEWQRNGHERLGIGLGRPPV